MSIATTAAYYHNASQTVVTVLQAPFDRESVVAIVEATAAQNQVSTYSCKSTDLIKAQKWGLLEQSGVVDQVLLVTYLFEQH